MTIRKENSVDFNQDNQGVETTQPFLDIQLPLQGDIINNNLRPEIKGLRTKLALGVAAVSLAFQQSPGNEIARGYAGLYALENTGNPLIAGVTFGVATLAIESVTGMAAANAFRTYSDKIHGFKDKVLSKFKRLKPSDQEKDSTFVGDSILALSVGSAAVVARRHYHDKNRTAKQDNLTVIKSAGGIAAVSALIAYGGAELVNASEGTPAEKYIDGTVGVLTDWKTYAIGGLAIGAYSLVKKMRKNNNETLKQTIKNSELVDIDSRGFTSLRIDNLESQIAKSSIEFEQKIWDKKGYGSLDEYNKDYLDQTRLFVTLKNDECIGITRVFVGSLDKTTPFIKDMQYYDDSFKQNLQSRFERGTVDELATSAFENSLESRNVIKSLWRLAYRDAVTRGVDSWGIIIEPKRAKILNRMNGFTFVQVGPEVEYQGGKCAPHVIDFEEYDRKAREEKPDLHKWFTDDPLSDSF